MLPGNTRSNRSCTADRAASLTTNTITPSIRPTEPPVLPGGERTTAKACPADTLVEGVPPRRPRRSPSSLRQPAPPSAGTAIGRHGQGATVPRLVHYTRQPVKSLGNPGYPLGTPGFRAQDPAAAAPLASTVSSTLTGRTRPGVAQIFGKEWRTSRDAFVGGPDCPLRSLLAGRVVLSFSLGLLRTPWSLDLPLACLAFTSLSFLTWPALL